MKTRQDAFRLNRRSLVVGSAAAGAASVSRVPRGRAQDEPVELRWSMWAATEAETAVWEDLAKDVNIAHPNITVKLETTSFGDYWDKLQTQLASGTEADIVAMQSLRMPVFAARDALQPLRPFIDADSEVNADDFFEPINNGLSFKDELFAFGYDLGPIMLFYNKDMFEAKGVEPPSATDPMTWEVFREKATALTDAGNGEYGYVIQPTFTSVIPWLWSGGGGYMNDDETESLLNSPESLEALTFIIGMITEDQIAAPITDLANTQFAREAFNSGKIGMTQDGPWQFVNTRKDASFAFDVAPLPAGPSGSVTWVAGSGFGISNSTENADAAWLALKVITSTESLMKTAAAGRGYPARQSAVPAFIDPTAPPENVAVVEGILANDMAQSRFLQTTTTWQETEVMLTQDFNPIFLGEQTVEEVVENVKPKFDDLLERHQELLNR
ncbi:MAG: sugar ABC transporter substrate-binding protein [Chloroflexota bacterium]|nr:sugar ABC transporter substrate-binding protein [Chloroflexota bacterium]